MSFDHEELIACAYFAGLVDGEGYIGAKRRMPGRNKMSAPKYSVAVQVSMTDREPIEALAAFCRAPERVKTRNRKLHYKTIYVFEVENDRAVDLLLRIQPYLLAKRRQADLALNLAKLRSTSRAHRTKPIAEYTFQGGRHIGGKYRTFGLSDEFIALCDGIYSDLLRGSPRSGNGRHGWQAQS